MFLGQADDQVKIRGFRIEPGEVQAVLAAVSGVAQAAVVAGRDSSGDTRLVAYFVAEEAQDSALVDTVLSEVGSHLPDYMAPPPLIRKLFQDPSQVEAHWESIARMLRPDASTTPAASSTCELAADGRLIRLWKLPGENRNLGQSESVPTAT